MSSRMGGALAAVLGVLLLGLAWWGWQQGGLAILQLATMVC
ncbi:hypothetical protein ACX0MV_11760 [Pseudomonas borbori]